METAVAVAAGIVEDSDLGRGQGSRGRCGDGRVQHVAAASGLALVPWRPGLAAGARRRLQGEAGTAADREQKRCEDEGPVLLGVAGEAGPI